jgi:hypothetical protein
MYCIFDLSAPPNGANEFEYLLSIHLGDQADQEIGDFPKGLKFSGSHTHDTPFPGSSVGIEEIERVLDQPWSPERSHLIDQWLWGCTQPHSGLTRLALAGGAA